MLFLSRAAQRDLAAIIVEGAERWGADAADGYARDLIGAAEAVLRTPALASSAADVLPGHMRRRFKSHVLVMRWDGPRTLRVVRIVHARADLPARLRDDRR